MKISKLFHWLYACVMLAPIFAVIGGVAYTVFNKNAKDSYSSKYVEQYSLVNSNSLIVENNYYQIVYNPNVTGNYSPQFDVTSTNLYDYVDLQGLTINRISIINESSYARINLTLSDNSTYRINNWDQLTKTFYFTLGSYNTFNSSNDMNRSQIYLVTYKTDTLDNAFYYGMEKMANSDLFKWASNSFLSQPITYVTGLFNMPNDSPFIFLMSYWLNISIIWLTFDLIMYVPLLVHRWIDKGVIE